MDYMLLTGGVNLAQKFFDGSLKLGVYAFHYSSGVVGNLYVRFELRVFQIVAFGSTISYYRNAEYERRSVSQFTEVMVPGTGMPTSLPMPLCLYTHGVPWALL